MGLSYNFRGPDLFSIAIEDGGWVFVPKRLQEAKRLHEIESDIFEGDFGVQS